MNVKQRVKNCSWWIRLKRYDNEMQCMIIYDYDLDLLGTTRDSWKESENYMVVMYQCWFVLYWSYVGECPYFGKYLLKYSGAVGNR